MLLMDVKGAFDAVQQDRLTSFMQQQGISPYLQAFTTSFLSERSVSITDGRDASRFFDVSIGVPQGSPLSPLLFAIYSASFCKAISSDLFDISFVDDFAFLFSAKSYSPLFVAMQKGADLIDFVSKEHGLEFSPPKTEAIVFCPVSDMQTNRQTRPLTNAEYA